MLNWEVNRYGNKNQSNNIEEKEVNMFNSIIIKTYLIIIIGLFLIGMFLPMIHIKKKGNDPHGTHEGASILTRMTPITIFSWLLYIILYIIYGNPLLHFLAIEILILEYFTIAGMVMIALGLLLDVWGTAALGSNFRIELPKEDTILITSGIYSIMRNPIVMGVYLLLLGSFFIIPTIISLIFILTNILTFNSKVRDEERFLSAQFGENYENYRKRVGKYLPFYTIKKKE
jgi:protein-S-isoprenylcysteine O-methyltransferase Ste14